MAAVHSLLALGAALLLAAGVRASKYSREANEGLAAAGAKRREAGEFRVVRLNQVWEKAQRVSEAAREERGRWRPSEGVLWQSSEGDPASGLAASDTHSLSAASGDGVRRQKLAGVGWSGGIVCGGTEAVWPGIASTGPGWCWASGLRWLLFGFRAWLPLTGSSEQDPRSRAPWGCPRQLGTAVLCKVWFRISLRSDLLSLCCHMYLCRGKT